ncbi:MAG: hypothetical protein ABJK11_12525 [Balneola sp.]
MNSRQMNSSFSFERVILLCKRYLAIKQNMILIGVSAMMGLLVLTYVGMIYFDPVNLQLTGSINVMTFAFIIFKYSGYGLASTMFYELNSKGSAPQFFTLPSNAFEKLVSAWLVSYVSYTIVGFCALYSFSLIVGKDPALFFSKQTLNELIIYSIGHSVYFFGAIYFKANNFLATLVSLISLSAIFMLVGYLIDTFVPGIDHSMRKFVSLFDNPFFNSSFGNLLLIVGLSGFFIWMSLVRLKNRQIA